MIKSHFTSREMAFLLTKLTAPYPLHSNLAIRKYALIYKKDFLDIFTEAHPHTHISDKGIYTSDNTSDFSPRSRRICQHITLSPCKFLSLQLYS